MGKEVPVSTKRNVMEACHKLIPIMNEEELYFIGIALNLVVERLEAEGRVKED